MNIQHLLNKAYNAEKLFFTDSFLNRPDEIRELIAKRRSYNFRVVKNYIIHALKNKTKINFSIMKLSPYMIRRWNLYKYCPSAESLLDIEKILN